ncbi:MAG: hypothetical protein AAF607_15860 [Pseudomonadota bacterium]
MANFLNRTKKAIFGAFATAVAALAGVLTVAPPAALLAGFPIGVFILPKWLLIPIAGMIAYAIVYWVRNDQ